MQKFIETWEKRMKNDVDLNTMQSQYEIDKNFHEFSASNDKLIKDLYEFIKKNGCKIVNVQIKSVSEYKIEKYEKEMTIPSNLGNYPLYIAGKNKNHFVFIFTFQDRFGHCIVYSTESPTFESFEKLFKK